MKTRRKEWSNMLTKWTQRVFRKYAGPTNKNTSKDGGKDHKNDGQMNNK